ncbi:glyoxylate/hydroxypyruvate reductase A [Paraburkholderia sp. C35]|uniref:2-hydroxyacid dehydrogenase n=1 Tax=Paraburkholderia sp. C35 TaxID=2126993 RepID=UPI000D697AC7|nr:glyoxylate/hydroxypyruvate reductase A [Paraburkholderia sp. C35]
MKPVLPFIANPTYPFTAQWIDALQRAMPDERIVPFDALDDAARATCEVAIVANPRPEDLRALPALTWVHSVWAGVERLVNDLGETDLKIVRLVDPQLADTMAEAVLAWTLYLHREMPRYAAQQAQRRWEPQEYLRPQHKTIGLLGLGALGEAAARRLLDAGFKVCGWSRSHKTLEHVDCYAGDDELPVMLRKCDIVVCLLPLTPQTTGLLNASTLSLLRKDASLINFARGPVIDDAALKDALDRAALGHAVLDVFAVEPLPEDSWHWRHPRVTVLPHISAPPDRGTASAIVAANIRRYRTNGTIPDAVNLARGY